MKMSDSTMSAMMIVIENKIKLNLTFPCGYSVDY